MQKDYRIRGKNKKEMLRGRARGDVAETFEPKTGDVTSQAAETVQRILSIQYASGLVAQVQNCSQVRVVVANERPKQH
jgi:hypothetical protein